MKNRYACWSKNPPLAKQQQTCLPFWPEEIERKLLEQAGQTTFLPFGRGRSYGDCCHNSSGCLIDTCHLNRWMEHNPRAGFIRCQAGVTLREVLTRIGPEGFFVPVSPGTANVTLGGMVAADVHGKNHHRAGSFGRFIRSFELLRSNGKRQRCSPYQNPEYFRSTIGGLGLTGLILWVEFELKPVSSAYLQAEHVGFNGIKDFLSLSSASESDFEYHVAWMDLSGPAGRQPGVLMRANHATDGDFSARFGRVSALSIGMEMPNFFLNPELVKWFNRLYYRRAVAKKKFKVSWEKFFYPLDGVRDWNGLYGKSGFYQYQCLLAGPQPEAAFEELCRLQQKAGLFSYLTVVKTFGSVPSLGYLSFPKPGIAVAMDFPNRGRSTLELFEQFDRIVLEAEGRINPVKDARMPATLFNSAYPELARFAENKDPAFCSGFWRRLT